MKRNRVSKAFSWLLILSLLSSPALQAFNEGQVFDELEEFPTLDLIRGLDQIQTPFGRRVKHTLYDIGEKVWLVSQKNQMDNAVIRLHDFDQPEFQDAIAAMMDFHALLDQAHEDGIPQIEAGLYSALRNREYADRFAIPLIGAAGVSAGYGSAVVRARMVSRFIGMLGLAGLGAASSKLEKAALYTLIGILTTAFLGSIFYHWRKYNKLWLNKKKQELERKLQTKHDKSIKNLEQKHVTELGKLQNQITKNEKTQNKAIATLSQAVTKKLTALQKIQKTQGTDQANFKQNINQQFQHTMAHQTELEKQLQFMVDGQNQLIQTVNQAWGAIALINVTGTGKVNQEQLAQFRLAGAEALRQFDKQIQDSNKRHNKFFNKFKTIRRRKSKPASPLLPLSPRNQLLTPRNRASSSAKNSLAPTLIISLPGDDSTE